MPARRGAAQKKSLARQEISSRKRQVADEKLKTSSAARRALLGVSALAVAAISLVSMLSFDGQDRSSGLWRNAAGPAGFSVADAVFGVLGVTGYVLPASALYAAMVLFVGRTDRRRWPQVLSAVLLCLSGSVLAHLLLSDNGQWQYAPGGALGATLSTVLTGVLSTVGTLIIVGAVCVAALIVGTQFAFLKLCSVAFHAAKALAAQGRVKAAALWAATWSAHRERREKAAAQKLEEAAFLAQLEADEDELLQAEKDAAEAEAIAEEAVRLSKPPPRRRDVDAPRMLPPPEKHADPAWAAQLQPEPPAKRARQKPNIAVPPVAALPKITAAPAEFSAPKLPPLLPANIPVAEAAAELAPAAPLAAAAPVVAAAAVAAAPAVIRTPVIVEPKAPPKPTKRKEQEQFQFVGDRKSFTAPPLDVLEANKVERTELDKEVFLSTAEKLRAKLMDFGIQGEVVEIRPGPVVTMYEFLPGPGIKVSKIASLADDLAMAMEAMRVRIVAPIPGKGVVGIEVPNKDRETVFLKEIAEQDSFTKSTSKLTMCLGKDIEGMPYVFDLAKAPHLLIAGTTGSGKSVAVNSMIMSLLLKATPEEVRFIMVDPKMLELSVYEGIPHLLLPVVTDPKKAALALRWTVEEMERRYHLLSEAGVRNIAGFNKLVDTVGGDAKAQLQKKANAAAPETAVAKAMDAPKPEGAKKKMLIVDVEDGESEEQAKERSTKPNEVGVEAPKEPVEEIRAAVELPPEPTPEPLAAAPGGEEKEPLRKLPYIVVIIDELADLMMVASREVETYIARLAQMARAAGIHLMVATQRPSTDVVTGVIKANFPTRISFMLRSKPDSMTILGTIGAEALLGMGDMLMMPPTSSNLERVHGAYVSETEIKRAVDHLKAQGKPVYDDNILKPREDEMEGGAEEDDLSDELYDQALATVSEMRQVSISMLQRKMRIGYNRAARMIERMEKEGVVGPADGAKPRDVLIRPLGEMPGAGAM